MHTYTCIFNILASLAIGSLWPWFYQCCLPGKAFVSSLFLKINFFWIYFLADRYFSLSPLTLSLTISGLLHFGCGHINLAIAHLWNVSFFSCCFQEFIFIFIFEALNLLPGLVFWFFPSSLGVTLNESVYYSSA